MPSLQFIATNKPKSLAASNTMLCISFCFLSILFSFYSIAPTKPKDLAATNNDTRRTIIVTWKEPMPTNGPITHYIIGHRLVRDDGVPHVGTEFTNTQANADVRTLTLNNGLSKL